uniref:Uncharacterized protein n=1 Tax=viral metagenome TaxID=1070528 RepID=A0A6H1ZGF2_9ZZZZ
MPYSSELKKSNFALYAIVTRFLGIDDSEIDAMTEDDVRDALYIASGYSTADIALWTPQQRHEAYRNIMRVWYETSALPVGPADIIETPEPTQYVPPVEPIEEPAVGEPGDYWTDPGFYDYMSSIMSPEDVMYWMQRPTDETEEWYQDYQFSLVSQPVRPPPVPPSPSGQVEITNPETGEVMLVPQPYGWENMADDERVAWALDNFGATYTPVVVEQPIEPLGRDFVQWMIGQGLTIEQINGMTPEEIATYRVDYQSYLDSVGAIPTVGNTGLTQDEINQILAIMGYDQATIDGMSLDEIDGYIAQYGEYVDATLDTDESYTDYVTRLENEKWMTPPPSSFAGWGQQWAQDAQGNWVQTEMSPEDAASQAQWAIDPSNWWQVVSKERQLGQQTYSGQTPEALARYAPGIEQGTQAINIDPSQQYEMYTPSAQDWANLSSTTQRQLQSWFSGNMADTDYTTWEEEMRKLSPSMPTEYLQRR